MKRTILMSLVFLLLIGSVLAAMSGAKPEEQVKPVEEMLRDLGCQTNDMWRRNGECFSVGGPCYICFDCYGPLCLQPFMTC